MTRLGPGQRRKRKNEDGRRGSQGCLGKRGQGGTEGMGKGAGPSRRGVPSSGSGTLPLPSLAPPLPREGTPDFLSLVGLGHAPLLTSKECRASHSSERKFFVQFFLHVDPCLSPPAMSSLGLQGPAPAPLPAIPLPAGQMRPVLLGPVLVPLAQRHSAAQSRQ